MNSNYYKIKAALHYLISVTQYCALLVYRDYRQLPHSEYNLDLINSELHSK